MILTLTLLIQRIHESFYLVKEQHKVNGESKNQRDDLHVVEVPSEEANDAVDIAREIDLKNQNIFGYHSSFLIQLQLLLLNSC